MRLPLDIVNQPSDLNLPPQIAITCYPILLSFKIEVGVITMDKAALETELTFLKADYMRIQEDMDKLEFVKGRVSSAEEQLVRLEEEIATVHKKLAALD